MDAESLPQPPGEFPNPGSGSRIKLASSPAAADLSQNGQEECSMPEMTFASNCPECERFLTFAAGRPSDPLANPSRGRVQASETAGEVAPPPCPECGITAAQVA